MTKEKIVKCFVPAQAIEHYSNPEEYSKADKIHAAIIRHELNGDFDSLITVQDPMPYVFIQHMEFRPKELGYLVVAKINY